MPFSGQDLLLGIALPAVVAVGLTSVAALFSRQRDGTARVAAPAVVLAFLLGYWLLELGPIRPESSSEWLPYSAVLALFPALIRGRHRLFQVLRLIVLGVVVAAAAWLLVPTWETLEPSRTVHLAVWWCYTFSLCVAMDFLEPAGNQPDRPAIDRSPDENVRPTSSTRGFLLLLLIIATLAAAAPFLALAGSLSDCQTALAAMAAFLGFTVVYALAERLFRSHVSLSGVSLVFALLMSAAMLTRKVNSFSSIPTASYLLLPLTPLACGLALSARDTKLTWKRIALILIVAAIIGGLALGMALAAEFRGESEY